MSNTKPRFRNIFLAIFSVIALVLILDFALTGEVINARIAGVQSEYQQYYNAAQNYHYSYMVFTEEHAFPVSESFAETVEKGDSVEFSVSILFKQVNWYRMSGDNNRSVYSLRLMAGLVAPLLALIVFFIAYRFKRNLSTLIFVLQAILLADLILTIIY